MSGSGAVLSHSLARDPLALGCRSTEEMETRMSVVELQELDEVKGLLAKGRQVGVLSYAEITRAMSELDLDESDVEELHGFLERAEIELVEDIDPAIAASAQVEREPAKGGGRKP